MVDKRSVGHAYNIDFLNVVFAVSSLFLFFSTVWMVWDDYDREWKDYQRRFIELETEVTQASLELANSQVDYALIEQLQGELEQAREELADNQEQVDLLEGELDSINAELFLATQEHQFTKAEYDAERYEFEELQESNPSRAEDIRPEITSMFEHWLELGLIVEDVTSKRDEIREEIRSFTGLVGEIDARIRELTTETDRLTERLVDLAPSLVNDYILNAPLLDFMAPTITVRQVITSNIVDDVNFTRVAKMDRCSTCHLAIDRDGYEDYPQPFKTHPNLETYVGSASPHPLGQFGCTVCHEGMGQSITFEAASHTPIGKEQANQWEKEHKWQEPHLWDLPMLPNGMTEASCAKCHRSSVFVPEAPKLNLAYALYERAGCYACHKTSGFEDLRKPGPNLTKISAKLQPEWVSRWIRNPRAIKSSTWMPRVWYNSNTNSEAEIDRNEAEIDAVVAYLFENSEDHLFAVTSPPNGNSTRGLELVESVGCLGCHVTGEEGRLEAGPRRTFGQPLQNIGNKTSFEWLFDWVRNPKHYSAMTSMPDLRLTDQEVADIASYLQTLIGSDGEDSRGEYNDAVVEEALVDYLRAIVPTEEARTLVSEMSNEERKLELGRRAIGRYGCYSCHEIKGFEETQPIGIELSEEGSKLLQRLDFAFVHDIPHTKVDWFKKKLSDPRVFDRNRVLQPLEKLRMPDFDFNEQEEALLATAIMSFQSDVQPVAAQVPNSARNDALTEGRNLVRRQNCVGCHEIEGDGGDYKSVVSDPAMAPPLLTPEGSKVKPEWLYAFFKGPITIRPWLDIRMPTFDFDDAHWNTLIDYFAAISETIGPFRTHNIVLEREVLSEGEELFELLRCQQCHVLDEIPEDQPTDNLAPDLRMAQERLQPDWIIEWLREPLAIQPGSKMPMFWTEYPGSFYPHFETDAVQQIRAVRDYLLTFRGGPSPIRQN